MVMAAGTQNFRSAVLGFDRNDVINYMEAAAREHRDEVEAHRRAAAVLRRERDEARDDITRLKEQMEHEREDSIALARQNEELFAKRILCTELSERLSKVNSELHEARGRIERLDGLVKGYEQEGLIIGRAKTRAAEIEMMAYKRAEAIELETMRGTEKARAALKRLMADTKGKYTMAKSEAEAAAYNVLQELGKLAEWLTGFPRLFDGVDEIFDSMRVHEKAQIKAFVPRRFDEDEPESAPPAADNAENEEETDI